MKLKIHDKNNSRKLQRNYPPTIYIRRVGVISLSATFCREVGLKPGDSVALAQDEERPKDWYLVTGQNGNGFELKEHRTRKASISLRFSNAALVRKIFRSLDYYEDSISLRIATKPVEEGIYAILTRSANEG